ncbi:hypothetical protein GTR02_18840 [Kineococcus sp. R8]|uniref:hypothetical protein n=1 Tax=Kineococcus siccus TaxID=2696567 RepID=UPI0014133827|nr:hypothetical protein [Kineococcus siccus]NAZ83871.1 hypothetical protein [Kineococcus siccus]
MTGHPHDPLEDVVSELYNGPEPAGWRVEHNAKPLPSEEWPHPGAVTDAEDERLARLRRRVVEPVVDSMMSAQEVQALSLHWGVHGRGGDVWIRIDAPGDRYEDWLPSPWWTTDPSEVDPPTSEAEIAEHLADRLQDWIAESAFAWGQLRQPDYQLRED